MASKNGIRRFIDFSQGETTDSWSNFVVLKNEIHLLMKTRLNHRKTAIVTSASIILMTVVAGVTMGGGFDSVFEMNPAQLAFNLTTIQSFMHYGMLGWIVIFICDLIATWGLHRYYREQNRIKANIMGVLRLIYSLILLLAITQIIKANVELSQSTVDYSSVHILLHKFQSIWQFGLILFGFHLLYLAPLVCKKKSVQQVISMLLFIAGIGYIISNVTDLFVKDYEQIRPRIEAVFILPMVLGEFGLAVWLLIKGGREVTLKKKQCVYGSC